MDSKNLRCKLGTQRTARAIEINVSNRQKSINFLKNMMTKAVLLDLDGTMVDSAPDIVEAANRTLREWKARPLGMAQIVGFIGNGVPTLVMRLLMATPGLAKMAESEAELKKAISVFYRHYDDTNGRFGQVFPGVKAGLAALKDAGFKLGCVTNKPGAHTEQLLAIFGLSAFVDVVVAGDSLPEMKPEAAPLLHACDVLGVRVESTVMVGDSHVDIAAARAASMRVYALRYGYPGPEGLAGLHPDAFIDSLEKLPALLRALF
jgi:phosphoglycolate phosphatase